MNPENVNIPFEQPTSVLEEQTKALAHRVTVLEETIQQVLQVLKATESNLSIRVTGILHNTLTGMNNGLEDALRNAQRDAIHERLGYRIVLVEDGGEALVEGSSIVGTRVKSEEDTVYRFHVLGEDDKVIEHEGLTLYFRTFPEYFANGETICFNMIRIIDHD